MITSRDLIPLANFGYNVLLSGRHGSGKTAVVKETFETVFGPKDEKWAYFSVSTLDPWVDFIGIPKNYTRPDGKEVFGIIPPERFTGDEKIEALFFDEINRAPDEKILNAIMELIQFKSINGRKFPHLKCVWGAENPYAPDDENPYSVRPLDPAQRDRFHVQLAFPYELNDNYMLSKFDKKVYSVAKSWWKNHKAKVSPRKLEDLLLGFSRGLDLSIFTDSVIVSELKSALESIGKEEEFQKFLESNPSKEKLVEFFSLENLQKYKHQFKRMQEKDDIFAPILKELPGEVQDYVKKIYKIDTKTTKLGFSNFGVIATDELKGMKLTSAKSPNHDNIFLDYIHRSHRLMKGYLDLVSSKEEYSTDAFFEDLSIPIFPFLDCNVLNTGKIAGIMNVQTDLNKLKTWYTAAFLMLILRKDKKSNRQATELLEFLKKLNGSRKFYDPMKMQYRILINDFARDIPISTSNIQMIAKGGLFG